MFRLIVLVLLLAGWGLAALALHVVRLPDDQYWVGIVPKNRLHWEETYLDVRTWTSAEIHAHPNFIGRVLETGKSHWLTHAVPDPRGDVSAQLTEILASDPPPVAPAPADDKKSASAAPLPPRHVGVK